MSFILAIDQGTTSSRAFIYNSRFERIGSGQKSFQQYFPHPGWVEHNLDEIWESVRLAIKDAISGVKDPSFDVKKIAAIGITNQRETFGLWDKKTHKPIAKAIVWQDRRSSEYCRKLQRSSSAKKISLVTGLVLDPYFSGSKLALQLKSLKETKNLAFGNIDTFLLWKLSNGTAHATDVSNASRTLLMNLKTLDWDPFLLKTFNVPASILPKILSSDARFGETNGLDFLPNGIPIHGILGDQQAALFGQGCLSAGEGKITYGTGAFMLVNTGKQIVRSKGALSTVAWKYKNKTAYALESSVFIAGAAVQWLRDGLKMLKTSSEVETLAKSVESTDGVFFIPALSGLGSPYWVPEARGIIGGLTRGSTSAHIARACLEGIAHSVADTFESLQLKGMGKKVIRVDGGASQNEVLMQCQSDLLQRKLERPIDVETTVRGAALMAALGVGMIGEDFLKKHRDTGANFKPKISVKTSTHLKNIWTKRVKALVKMSI
ncbi:MAG: glycerol kinase [Bdellovibrionota bacterium]